MNVDDDSNININKVRSKYFTREHMDDSLIDFQETKKINTGPKTSKAITKKPRKTSKRIKGQKDIRSALKTKKDELVAYTKEFDVICRKSGIDVDPEQLELAIALSKSLQTEPINGDFTSKISTQENTKRIRNTLQEYGFKVPEIKTTTKKLKKKLNSYKLFSCTNDKRLQVITDRFAEVLLKNIINFKTKSVIDFSKTPLYYLSTSISYEEIKNDKVFYVDGLIDRSNRIGSLLRNWAEIPGRPLSPVNIDYFEMNFSEIECSQDELDLALSGSLKVTKNIIKSKQNENTGRNIYTPDTNNQFNKISPDNCLKIQNKMKIDVGSQLLQHEYRSCSPDIFEDEISASENFKNNISLYEDKLSYMMDLTECVNVKTDLVTKIVDKKVDCHNVNKSNISRIKLDDVMEISECVASTSRFNNQFMHNHEIDLTQSYNNLEDTLIENRSENNDIDLTQSSNSSNELPIVHLPECSVEDTIIINASDYENIINTRNITQTLDKQEIFDLTQDCKITELNEEKSSTKGVFEDYVYGHSDHSGEHFEHNEKCSDENKVDITKTTDSLMELNYKTVHDVLYEKIVDDNENKNSAKFNIELDKPTLDIINISCETTEENIISGKKTTSLNKTKECKEVDVANASDSHQIIIVENEQFNSYKIQSTYSNIHNDTKDIEDEIDLTQHSFHIKDSVKTTSQKIRNSSLGKKDNISIDYDEIPNEIKYHSAINGVTISKSVIYEIADEFNMVDKVTNHSESDETLGLSQHSEVFEIIDNELNYSLLQSRHENFNTSGISATNHSSLSQKLCEVINLDHNDTIAGHSNDLENLPKIHLKGTQEEPVMIRSDNENVNLLETPKSNNFIIKTGEVTPMKDFASMSTPERNKELDKFGIKPFKRKRAIQLLTYIYNQTHPIIDESLDYVQSSPKKSKRSSSPQKSPKISKSPKKISMQHNENNKNVYGVTNEVPIIREFYCSVEDWVFQKREKAKVHSCRVPLHVAFHNYVSCRRGLREAILRYEPVNIDIIHKELVGYGHRYDPKDLLKFLDKKCITVKTRDNNGRNNKN